MAILLFVIYFGSIMLIGTWGAKKMNKKDSGDFVLAGRSVPLWMVTGGVIATLINGTTLIGYGGSGYSLGLTAYFSALGYMVALTWMGYWFIPRLRRANLTTVPELFNRFFGLPHKVVAVILVMCRDIGVTAGATIAMAVVFVSVFGVSLDIGILISLVITLTFTVLGGMWAVMLTDTIQAVVIVIGTTLMIPLGIAYLGGWTEFTNLIPEMHTNIFSAGGSQVFGWFAAGTLTFIGYQTLIQRGLSAESEEVAKKSFIYGGAIAMVWYMVPFVVGIIALVIFPNIDADQAYISLAELFGPIASILFAIIVVSSSVSTLSSSILTTASNISLDIYRDWINPNASEKVLVVVTRISVIIVAIAGALIGRSLPFILELLLTGGRIMASSLAPVLLGLVFWKAARKAYYSTVLAMILGAGGTIAGIIIGNQLASNSDSGVIVVWALDPMLIGLPITLITFIAGTLIENKIRRNKRVETSNKIKAL